jgi:hypothetical protein
LILEEISLLKTVFENPESVLLARNLNNYIKIKRHVMNNSMCFIELETYLNEKMNIKIGASCVLLVRVLNSTSFD